MIETFLKIFIKSKHRTKQNYLLLFLETEAWSSKFGCEILSLFWFPLFCSLVVPENFTDINVIEDEKTNCF